MLINKTSKMANLTKKAIEYYIEQGLILPDTLDNGYRDFNVDDVERLKKISVLRKLGLSISEIQTVLADEGDDALKKLSIQKELAVQRGQARNAILDKQQNAKIYILPFI